MNFRRFREHPILGDPGAVSRVLKNGGERFHKPACVAGVEMGKGLEGRGKGRGIWERGYCDWATKSIFVPNQRLASMALLHDLLIRRSLPASSTVSSTPVKKFPIISLARAGFLQFDWLGVVVFQLNLKYLHAKITNLLRVVV